MMRLPGWVLGGQHQILDRGRPDQLFERTENLGQGSIGFVGEVKFRNVTMGIVRKRVFLRKGRPGEVMKKIVDNEVNVLRSLRHIHIVRLISTYEDVSTKGIASVSILMSPVGDLDLEHFLSEVEAQGLETRHTHCIWLRSWFSCLASALTYIHSQGIRHEDIKPSNIIHRGNRIFFTDFSSSTRFRLGEITSTESQARTSALYAAPETRTDPSNDRLVQLHSSRSDVFSLGCVFLEMLTVISGSSVDSLHSFCRFRLNPRSDFGYHHSLPALDVWFAGPHIAMGPAYCRIYRQIIKPMLSRDRKSRPEAEATLSSLQEKKHQCLLPCGCSCVLLQREKDTLERQGATAAMARIWSDPQLRKRISKYPLTNNLRPSPAEIEELWDDVRCQQEKRLIFQRPRSEIVERYLDAKKKLNTSLHICLEHLREKYDTDELEAKLKGYEKDFSGLKKGKSEDL